MEKRIAVLLAEGFEEGEALVTVDVLRRAGFTCETVAVGNQDLVAGAHQIIVQADRHLADVEQNSYDMVVLPGGLPGADYLRDDPDVVRWVQQFAQDSEKFVAAICAAPQVLAKADVVRGRRVTSYPGDAFRTALREAGAEYIEDEAVVADGNIITSRGPATVLPFAYKLVETLGTDPVPLQKGMLYL